MIEYFVVHQADQKVILGLMIDLSAFKLTKDILHPSTVDPDQFSNGLMPPSIRVSGETGGIPETVVSLQKATSSSRHHYCKDMK